MVKKKIKSWEPTIPFLIDLLSIVTLKSVILGAESSEKKSAYEKEAQEIMKLLTERKMNGKFIRAIQIGMLANRLIWENETKTRQGDRSQDHLLPLTHTINGLRMRAGNAIANQLGERKDLNLDRMSDKLCKKFGFNFEGIFE